ncbi:MAG: hypothetical protein K8L99_00805 [Anaerolineae bacterium]|nr:hypothetical protein [Anaerolineae bacterium]
MNKTGSIVLALSVVMLGPFIPIVPANINELQDTAYDKPQKIGGGRA